MGVNWTKLKALLAMPASATNPERDHELAAMVPELVWELATAGVKEAQMPKPTLVRMEGWHEFAGRGGLPVNLPAKARLQDCVVKTHLVEGASNGTVIGEVVATHGESYYARYYNLVHVDVMVEPEHLELARKYEVKVPADEAGKPNLSKSAEVLLGRLKELAKHFMYDIYVDELPAANELVKAGLATFPAKEDRYSTNVKYLVVALISEGTGWKAEGTLPPLSERELQAIENVAKNGAYSGLIDDDVERLIGAGILSRDTQRAWQIEFAPAVKARHMRQPKAEAPKPAEYVRESGEPIPFEEVGMTNSFLWNGGVYYRSGVSEGAIFGMHEHGFHFGQEVIVQPVTITWEKQ